MHALMLQLERFSHFGASDLYRFFAVQECLHKSSLSPLREDDNDGGVPSPGQWPVFLGI